MVFKISIFRAFSIVEGLFTITIYIKINYTIISLQKKHTKLILEMTYNVNSLAFTKNIYFTKYLFHQTLLYCLT